MIYNPIHRPFENPSSAMNILQRTGIVTPALQWSLSQGKFQGAERGVSHERNITPSLSISLEYRTWYLEKAIDRQLGSGSGADGLEILTGTVEINFGSSSMDVDQQMQSSCIKTAWLFST
jgi:hypothetical protein